MKSRLILLILTILSFSGFKSYSQVGEGPIIRVELSELYFDDNDNWNIELYYNFNIPVCRKCGISFENPVDSILIISSSGIARLKNTDFFSLEGYCVITNDSLISNLDINRNTDSVSILSYFNLQFTNQSFRSVLVFGDFPNSRLKAPLNGQSIILIGNSESYCRTNNPSIGTYNNSNLGTKGTLKGKIYDKNNNLFTNPDGRYYHDFQLVIDSEGNYTTDLYSRADTIRFLSYDTGILKVDVLPLPYNIDPDSTLLMDIHLTSELYNSVKTEKNPEFVVYPNPAADYLYIRMEGIKDIDYKIFSTDGRIMKNGKAGDDLKMINIRSLQNGLYFVEIKVDNIAGHRCFVVLR
jgi:hypothetical protein